MPLPSNERRDTEWCRTRLQEILERLPYRPELKLLRGDLQAAEHSLAGWLADAGAEPCPAERIWDLDAEGLDAISLPACRCHGVNPEVPVPAYANILWPGDCGTVDAAEFGPAHHEGEC